MVALIGSPSFIRGSDMRFQKIALSLSVLIVLGGCQTTPDIDPRSDLSISIPYDPYNFDPQRLDSEAQAHCDAYGLRAVFEDETIDNQSVRWRYRHYACL